ncbi:tetracycline resistance protein, class H-like [Xenia sp. Carnegie-2017]|uniref:tetracycline resistance protein, class H-like n=1 Tax=Xenia sp. Carnegie-2017 TaxID=2897299 RepID=UPI001F04913D|nr:tetracycline resistance protein, class H-like [Xenia sp. Carnegie-2017]XP_046854328.1 tetracycline resistance protein, class H-like [Xenia sp. Carnegie-2017]
MKLYFTYLKPWIFFLAAFRFFMEGSEESFIAPSAWFYIKSLGEDKVFLGIVLSAFPVAAVISLPILGKIADKYGNHRTIIIACFALKVASNVLYAVPISVYCPLFGRLFSGIAEGSAGVLNGKVVEYTSELYRAKVFLILDGLYTVGSLFAPAVSAFLNFNANVLGWKINAGNAPGIANAFLFSIFLFASLCLPLEFGTQKVLNYEADQGEWELTKISKKNFGSLSTVLMLYYLVFSAVFYSVTVTFFVPLLAQENFHLRMIHLQMLFLVSAIFWIVLILSCYIASKYFDARFLMAFSVLTQLAPMCLLAFIGFHWDSGMNTSGGYILIPYICLGAPYFAFALGSTLLSKITNPKETSFYQGLLFSASHFGFVAGRITAPFMFHKNLILLYCGLLFLTWIAGAIWFAFEYKNLRSKTVMGKSMRRYIG